MAESVNPTETPPLPSNTAPSISTPSQPPPLPQASSPLPQTPATSTLPAQPPLPSQQPPQSPAPTTMPPSGQPPPQIHTNTPTYPARAPPGAPGRNYLNTHLAPYLRNGMNNILDAKPQYPLRWLGEYLISQSLIHEGGTDDTGVVERFIYEEHGEQVVRMRPEARAAAVGQSAGAGADHGMVNGVEEKEGEEGENIRERDAGAGEEDTEMGGR